MSNNQPIKYTPGSLTPKQIEAHGNFQTRIAVIWAVSVICGLLAFGGIIFSCLYPDKSKDIWVIVGPIISAGITGMIGFLAGERNASGK